MSSMPFVPRIVRAQPGDVPALARMRGEEGWAVNGGLLSLLVQWPRARVLMLRDSDGRAQNTEGNLTILGSIVATGYGNVGFIGNVIVAQGARGRGYGKVLMTSALDWLRHEGAQSVVLDATETGRPLYERFGFVGTVHSWEVWQPLDRLALAAQRATPGVAVTELVAGEVGDLAALDREAFGGDRIALVSALSHLAGTRAYVARDPEGAVEGYLLMRPLEGRGRGLYIGPFVARSPGAARQLFVEALRREQAMLRGADGYRAHLALGIPGTSSAALNLYRSLGVPTTPDDLRMRLDLTTVNKPSDTAQIQSQLATGRPEWLYSMLSPMVG